MKTLRNHNAKKFSFILGNIILLSICGKMIILTYERGKGSIYDIAVPIDCEPTFIIVKLFSNEVYSNEVYSNVHTYKMIGTLTVSSSMYFTNILDYNTIKKHKKIPL